MKKILLSILLAFLGFMSSAQPTGLRISSDYPGVEYYMPQGADSFDEKVPDPIRALGYNFAERFVEWSDIVGYMETLARTSDRVSIQYFGYSFEKRPFVQICITSPKNRSRLEQIRESHLALDGTGPLVINLMGSIHGNEISGVTSLLPVAYYYAASRSPKVEELLQDAVIVITPGQNPDGINRFATWVNGFSGLNHWVDAAQMEYNQAPIKSRGNHWWRDCNRDWLTCQFDVGRECVRMYRHWMPNVVLDLHEQGSKRGFYFSPGDSLRTHKYIPQKNQDLTLAISRYTGKALESIGTKYFSQKGYDDFFIGKGAAYCDVQGSVGILHEQSSTRGHVADFGKKYGEVTFQQTVRNQCYSAYAVTEGAFELRSELLAYQREFYENAATAARRDKAKAWVFNTRGDRGMAYHVVDNLIGHGIEVYRNTEREDGFIVPTEQRNYYLAKCILEDITEYADSTFYDVSTWSIGRAFNLDMKTVRRLPKLGARVEKAELRPGHMTGKADDPIYGFDLTQFYTPYMISALQHRGISLNVSDDGMVWIPAEGQNIQQQVIADEVLRLSKLCGVDVRMLGDESECGKSTHVRSPKVCIFSKDYSRAGELWYWLDYRLGIECSVVDENRPKLKYDGYDVIFASSDVGDRKKLDRLRKWVEAGGTLLLTGKGCAMASEFGNGKLTTEKGLKMGHKGVRGVVLNAHVEHGVSPLLWGYDQTEIPLFKANADVWTAVPDVNRTILSWGRDGYLSGCISEANLQRIYGTPALFTIKCGRGVVVCSQCDLAYRSYWLCTLRMVANAIFFGDRLQ